MIAAQTEHPSTTGMKGPRNLVDRSVGLVDIDRIGARVPRVDDLLLGERRQLERVVVRTQKQGRLADRARPVARTGPKGRTTIERRAENRHIGMFRLLERRKPSERAQT